jgi:three-Cys-motif partner protein
MASCSGRAHFLDAFAGPGRYEGGEEGSPLIAIRTLIRHPHFQKPRTRCEFIFTFIERDARRAKMLEQSLAGLSLPTWVKWRVWPGEFAPLAEQAFSELEASGKHLAPTFAFIDPFGFAGVPLRLISRLAKNQKCECLINFMYEEINRFLGHPALERRYDDLFGCQEWRQIADVDDPDARCEGASGLYQRQLHEAGFKYVREFQVLRTARRTKYFLYFCTNSPVGLSKMKEAMWKADPLAGQKFLDRTDVSQQVLFGEEPDLYRLRRLLVERFAGEKWTPIEQVSQFVLFDTPYSERIHLKRRTLQPMESRKPPAIEVRGPSGKLRRRGTYPPGTLIRFIPEMGLRL